MKDKKGGFISVLTYQCPVCRETSIFNNPALYTLNRLGDTKDKCEVCGTQLKPEPGFFYGSMYVAWGLIVALWIAVLVALNVLDAIGVIEYGFLTHPATFLTTGLLINMIAFPYLFRLSRSIWATMFIRKPQETQVNTKGEGE